MEVIKLDDFPINPIQDQIYEIIPDKTKIVASTNRLFNKYPTRYISAVPRFAINAYSKAGETVLDPFCGSGTTAIEAMLLGRNAISIDIDPFARLLIKVKTTVYSKEDIDFLDEVVRKIKEMSPTRVFSIRFPVFLISRNGFVINQFCGFRSLSIQSINLQQTTRMSRIIYMLSFLGLFERFRMLMRFLQNRIYPQSTPRHLLTLQSCSLK